ncbi:phage portal protein family protein [Veronia nyctiphanis]
MVTKPKLTREIAGATAIRNPWGSGSAASGLTPARLASILIAAGEGDLEAYLTLAEEMEERDPHYSSVLRTRKLAVAGLPVNIEAGGEDSHSEKLADAVRELTEAPEFGELVDNALDALGKGFSVNEIMWDRSGETWTPSDYRWRDPRFFQFHQQRPDELRLMDERDPVHGIPLAPYKFVIHKPRMKSG